MSTGRSRVARVLRQPRVLDGALGLGLGAAFLLFPLVASDRKLRERGIVLDLTTTDVALTGACALALTQARRRPLVALVITATACLIAIVGGWDVNLAQVAVGVALFAFGLERPRRQLMTAAAVTSLALGAAAVVAGVLQGHWGGRQNVVLVLWLATAAAVAVSSRRAAMVALEDRARRAEETREQTALRRVAEDRVRIARELHDVIAHHVAAISVQSGVAEHMVDRDPAAAREAMHQVRTSARSVLSELQSVLGVLRQDESALPTAPAPGLAALPDLVRSARSMGTSVELVTPASMPPLGLAADSAGFRLVQEALTNVRKHAPGAAAAVRVATTGESVVVTVTNGPPSGSAPGSSGVPSPADVPPGSRLGLLGMRERVVAAGGSLVSGPTDEGGFSVEGRLPLAQEDR